MTAEEYVVQQDTLTKALIAGITDTKYDLKRELRKGVCSILLSSWGVVLAFQGHITWAAGIEGVALGIAARVVQRGWAEQKRLKTVKAFYVKALVDLDQEMFGKELE